MHQCAYKTLRTETGLIKKKIRPKNFIIHFLIAPELSSPDALFLFLSCLDVSALIPPIARTTAMHWPPISNLHFEKQWSHFIFQILQPICFLDNEMYMYFSSFSIIKLSSGLEIEINLKLTIKRKK